MTKAVRIENADTSSFKVVVQVWDKGPEGAPDVLAQEVNLDYPTAMTNGLYLTSTRYLVVKEASEAAVAVVTKSEDQGEVEAQGSATES